MLIIRTHILLALLWAVLGVLPRAAFAADECGDCVQRKSRLCSDECEEVEADRARSCQHKCITGYCSHKCQADAFELKNYISGTCDDCLEQQFDLCDPHCSVGTERRRSLCKLKCSGDRCGEACQKPKKAASDDEE